MLQFVLICRDTAKGKVPPKRDRSRSRLPWKTSLFGNTTLVEGWRGGSAAGAARAQCQGRGSAVSPGHSRSRCPALSRPRGGRAGAEGAPRCQQPVQKPSGRGAPAPPRAGAGAVPGAGAEPSPRGGHGAGTAPLRSLGGGLCPPFPLRAGGGAAAASPLGAGQFCWDRDRDQHRYRPRDRSWDRDRSPGSGAGSAPPSGGAAAALRAARPRPGHGSAPGQRGQR